MDIVDYVKPEGKNYMILEILNKEDNQSRGMHVICLENEADVIKIVLLIKNSRAGATTTT